MSWYVWVLIGWAAAMVVAGVFGISLGRAAAHADARMAAAVGYCRECGAPPGAECQPWCTSLSTRP